MPNPGLKPEVRQQIEIMLVAGKTPNEIVSELGVSHSSVSRTKAQLPPEVMSRLKEEDIETINNLVQQTLISGLEATIEISNQVKNEDWRKAQPANQLGILYGVISDKSVRLLEAAENAALAAAAEKSAELTDLAEEGTIG